MVNRLDRPCQYEPASREIRLADVMPWENSVSYWTRYPSLRGDGLQTASCFENETGLPLTLIGKDEKTKIKRFFKKIQAIHSCGRTQRRLKTQTVRIRWCERRGGHFFGSQAFAVKPRQQQHLIRFSYFSFKLITVYLQASVNMCRRVCWPPLTKYCLILCPSGLLWF